VNIALERAEKIAAEVIKRLSPYCAQIQVAGSVRRKKPWVKDVDLVLVPSDPWNVQREIMVMGQVKMSGAKIMRVTVMDIQIDGSVSF